MTSSGSATTPWLNKYTLFTGWQNFFSRSQKDPRSKLTACWNKYILATTWYPVFILLFYYYQYGVLSLFQITYRKKETWFAVCSWQIWATGATGKGLLGSISSRRHVFTTLPQCLYVCKSRCSHFPPSMTVFFVVLKLPHYLVFLVLRSCKMYIPLSISHNVLRTQNSKSFLKEYQLYLPLTIIWIDFSSLYASVG